MSNFTNLKAAHSLSDVAILLNVPPQVLSYILYKIPQPAQYTSFTIPKKNGGSRTIEAPNARLKLIQTRTSGLLYDCYRQLYPKLNNTHHEISHAFQKGSGLSIYSNANKHHGKRFVFNVDIEDFFSSINFGRVRGFFLSNRDFQLDPKVATIIAQICCYNNALPQGAPTSPIVSELITRILDLRLAKLAKYHRCTYSRYADDITFSTDLREFPDQIAALNTNGIWNAGNELANKILNSGFNLNTSKTRMQIFNNRQVATGLTVNSKVNLSKQNNKLLRSMCHHYFKHGSFHEKGDKSSIMSVSQLNGKLAHQFFIKGHEYKDKNGKFADLSKFKGNPIPEFYRRYGDFVYFTNFFKNSKPIILCEGETDNIYLSCAIRRLANNFPFLAVSNGPSKNEEITFSKTELLVKFFTYSKTAKLTTELTGGAPLLKKFVEKYDSNFGKFNAASEIQPVIIVVDNDVANNGLWDFLKNKLKIQNADGSQEFYHATKNLYIVPIPKLNGSDTVIEHLFEPQVLETVINGKTFDPNQKKGDKIGPENYSKRHFAEKVIKKNYLSINFNNFNPVLENITKAIKDHNQRRAKIQTTP